MNSIGFKIKNLRENYNTYLSQEDLALELGTKQTILSRIESGATEKIDFLLSCISKILEKLNENLPRITKNNFLIIIN